MTTAAPAFRKGGDAASEAAKAQGGGKFAKVNFFQLPKPEDTAVLRYVTDSQEWIWVEQHASVPTKNKPKDHEGKWPATMPAVCRHDDAFKGIYDDCYICDNEIQNTYGRFAKATVKIYAVACLREEVICTQEMHEADPERFPESKIGKRVGYTDATREVAILNEKGEDTGKTKQELALVVVNMAPSNYFDGLNAIWSTSADKPEPGEKDERTICNQDFLVKRTGEGTDTVYFHIGKGETPNLNKDSEKWKKYTDAMKEQGLDLGALVADKASDDYYARFFDPTKTPASKGDKGGKSESRPEVPEGGSNDVDDDKLAEMRARVRGSSTAGAAKSAAAVDVD